MRSNLPPGVSEGMIPGNRPEDAWYEEFFEALNIPPVLMYEYGPEKMANLIEVFLGMIEKAHDRGFAEGQQEAKMEAATEGGE